MKKKDYIKIADILKLFNKHNLSERNANDVIAELTGRLMVMFVRNNPRFDGEKFINYINK